MVPVSLSDRLDAMIDDLIMEGGIESASLASILLAARDSLNSDTLLALSRTVWAANNGPRSVLVTDPNPTRSGEENARSLHEPARAL